MNAFLKVVLFTLVLVPETGWGQIKFQKVYGSNTYNYGYALQQTADTGYIICGTTSSDGLTAMDILLVKVDFGH